ncbi:MAG TPA: phosphate regulon sensor histidine kinase PhoR [Steroidobacteraceae bacterium]|jgi:two-component system phosphate regulon sensor histidine kinase PhoR|nr:phosphate regulon sensor histidine kinase PhoR [Steroidobacteraceae bacterium]
MNTSSAWWPQSLRLLLAVLIGGGVGLLVGALWLALAVTLALLLALQIRQLSRLLRWLKGGRVELAPDLAGPWGELVGKILRLYRRKQFHRQRLLRLLRELRRSTAAMPDGVVVLNPQTEILWFNRTAARLLGFRGKGDIGLRIENLVRQPEFVRYLRSGQYATPVSVRTTAGPELHLSLQIVPYGDGQLLALVRDVTREARLEAMRRDFVANASHELRSPLTVIAGYLETLAQEPGSEAMQGPLQEMRRQAARMNRIVQDLLELSRLESSAHDAPSRPIDVAELVGQLRRDVLARIPPRGRPRLTVQLRVDSRARLLGEETQIHSAFANLVDNAVQYTPGGGSVQLRWWTDSDGGHFSVTDTGIGIAGEHLPRLTERFYRVDPGRSRSTGGSGLGLAIVKHVLQRHGAQLSIESEEGRGSCFCCHFPPARLQHATALADGAGGPGSPASAPADEADVDATAQHPASSR